MQRSNPIPPGSLSLPRRPFKFVALDVSRYQDPADTDSPVLDQSPSLASGGAAPTEPQHDAPSAEATSVLKGEKPLRWLKVDPTEVHGSLRFRHLPIYIPEPITPSAPKSKRTASRKIASKAHPVAHVDYPNPIKSEPEEPTLQRVPSSGKAKGRTGKRKSALDPQYRFPSGKRSSSRSDTSSRSRGSVETDSVSSATDWASQLRDSEPPPPPRSQSPSPEEERKFIPKRSTFFDLVLNPE